MTKESSRKPGETIDRLGFKDELLTVIPHLRAFARGLCGRPDLADDLVQESLVRMWGARDRFVPGSSLRAWGFTILRNAYISSLRRDRFGAPYDQELAENLLRTEAAQEGALHLSDMHRLLLRLPAQQREAVLLIGAGDFSYQEAAEIAGCAVGTLKSRVSRARALLTEMLDSGADLPRSTLAPADVVGAIMSAIPQAQSAD